jgi:hypothetical protein
MFFDKLVGKGGPIPTGPCCVTAGGDEHSFTDGELRLWLLIHGPSLQPIDYARFAYTHCTFNTLAGLS